MIRYTTPTLILEVPKDLTNVDVYVSLEQNGELLDPIKIGTDDKHFCDDVTKIYVHFDQNTTGKFKPGASLRMQINWIDSNGIREATDVRTVSVTDNLLEEVLSYAG